MTAAPLTLAEMTELRRLVRYSLRLWRHHPEYEDLYSEALLHAWQACSHREADGAAWTTIAVKAACYQALDYLRSRKSGLLDPRRGSDQERPIPLSSLMSLDDELSSDAIDGLMPSEGGIAAADARLQWDLLRGRLTKRQRRALLLVVGWEMSLGEAADRLGCSIFTVAAAVRQGIHASREALGLPVELLPVRTDRRAPRRGCGACFHCRMPIPPPERTGIAIGRRPLYCSPLCKSRALEAQRRADRQGVSRQDRPCQRCRQTIPADRPGQALFCSPQCKSRDSESRRTRGCPKSAAPSR